MRRGFWFVAGAGTGVYVMIRARRAAEVVVAVVQAAAVGAPRSVRRDPDLLVDHVLHCCLPDGAGARREEDVVLLAARFDET